MRKNGQLIHLFISPTISKSDSRTFRVDRVAACALEGLRFLDEPGRMLADYLAKVDAEIAGDDRHNSPIL
jgi:hypothetical protein